MLHSLQEQTSIFSVKGTGCNAPSVGKCASGLKMPVSIEMARLWPIKKNAEPNFDIHILNFLQKKFQLQLTSC